MRNGNVTERSFAVEKDALPLALGRLEGQDGTEAPPSEPKQTP